jgi:hypothetical protein
MDWDSVGQMFSMMFGILDALGVLEILGWTLSAILMIGVTFRVIDAIGNR